MAYCGAENCFSERLIVRCKGYLGNYRVSHGDLNKFDLKVTTLFR